MTERQQRQDPDWVFDPRPPSGALQRGAGWTQTLSPGLRTLVRETLQNSRDQGVEGETVHVRFTLQTLTGEALERFLGTFQWPSLEAHVLGAIDEGGPMTPRLARTLSGIREGRLDLLVVEDGNARGLVGGEDEPHANFNGLCRNVLDSGAGRQGRGGSYGLGKGVLWRFSGLSTVLFGSRPLGEEPGCLRLFGRTELPGHGTSEGVWNGPGWFGEIERDRRTGEQRAVSLWEGRSGPNSSDLGLDREDFDGPGTSILVVGFQEPTEEEPRPPAAVMDEILRHAVDSFWPGIAVDDPPTLQVDGRVLENDRPLFERSCELERVHGALVRATTVPVNSDRASGPGDVVAEEIPFTVPPEREAGPGESRQARFALRLTREDPGKLPAIAPPPNSIALIRGAGMVVDYYPVPGLERRDPPVWGVLLAGFARGSEDGDRALEAFLRAAEPVTHEKWEVTERIQQAYRQGAGAEFRRLWKTLREAVPRLTREGPDRSGRGPERLRGLFPLGPTRTSAGKGNGGFRVQSLDASLDPDRGAWTFRGRVEYPEAREPWGLAVSIWLDAESGRGLPVPLETLTLLPEGAGNTVHSAEGGALCRVAAGHPRIELEGHTPDLTVELSPEFVERTRIRIEITEAAPPEDT